MYPQRNPVLVLGKYTVHSGKLSADDSRGAWIEGPDMNGRLCPIASFWNVEDAIQRVRHMVRSSDPSIRDEIREEQAQEDRAEEKKGYE